MKKWIILTISAIAVIVLSGCGGAAYDAGYDDRYSDGFYDGARVPSEGMTTLFLVDLEGYSLGGVPYTCEDPSGVVTADYVTAPNGEFSFIPGERCHFDFLGFYGTPGDPLFIKDDIGRGKPDIPYSCYGGDNGFTDISGSFDYLPDDICTFYL